MNETDGHEIQLSRGITFLFILSIFLIAVKLGQSNVVYVWILIVAMFALGIPSFFGGFVKYGQYKNVFDYEPTTFLGKEKNGKDVRKLLLAVIYLGLWSCLAGVFLLAFLQLGLV